MMNKKTSWRHDGIKTKFKPTLPKTIPGTDPILVGSAKTGG